MTRATTQVSAKEIQFILYCSQYNATRDLLLDSAGMFNNDFNNLNTTGKLKMMLTLMWKDSSCFVLKACTTRHAMLCVEGIKQFPKE